MVDPDDVDVHRFERLAGEGRRALSAGDHLTAARLLGEALALWRGPALADVTNAPFAEAQAARLEELRMATIEDYAEVRLARGDHRDLVAELPEIVAAHPLRERLRGQLMQALYGCGRQAEAIEVFEDARRTLADELGLDPSPELGSVHRAVLKAERSLAECPAPGFPLSSPVSWDARASSSGSVICFARLARRLLTACRGLRILVTSRERLDITGETLYPVVPLTLPPQEAADLDMSGHPAVRLFADRAAAVRPGFTADGATIGAVLRVCRALDGLPQAIRPRNLPLSSSRLHRGNCPDYGYLRPPARTLWRGRLHGGGSVLTPMAEDVAP